MKTVVVILGAPVFAVRHCERQRSNPSIRNERVDCFVAALLAMTIAATIAA
jgi:hypothetical protein